MMAAATNKNKYKGISPITLKILPNRFVET